MDIAKNLDDSFSKVVNAPVKAVSDTVDKANNFIHGKGFTANPDNGGDTSWHDSMVKAANTSFKDAAAKPASTPKPTTPPKYHKGTDYVPKTGPAILKKGEAVLNTDDAGKMREAKMKHNPMQHVSEELGGKSEAKPEKKIKTMHIKHSANGGHIIKHEHTHPEHHPDEEHTTKTDDELADHVMQHMGQPNPGEAEADAGQSGAPDAGAAAGGAAGGAAGPSPQAGPVTPSPVPGM